MANPLPLIPLADVVRRIYEECPSFASVQHAITSGGQDALPSALVSPVRYIADPPPQMTGFIMQPVRMMVGVFIQVDREQDPYPDYPLATLLDVLQAEVRGALVGWVAPGADLPFDYVGGELAPYKNDGPAIWREDFATATEIRR